MGKFSPLKEPSPFDFGIRRYAFDENANDKGGRVIRRNEIIFIMKR